jgi:spore coat polysaccharide biosynthesis protein SpsF
MRVVASVEARMGSSRLPGKNGRPICGKPMLARLLERLKASSEIDVICVATTEQPADDRLMEIARQEDVATFRGSTDDVLSRVLGAATSVAADVIVEITGDCPLSDPRIIDAVVRRYKRGGYDYVANILDELTFPAGFDVQVFSRELLAEAAARTTDRQDREDVTRYFYRTPERHRLLNLRAPRELDRPRYWLCVDHPEDFQVISAVYEALLPHDPMFSGRDAIAFLDGRPDLVTLNTAREGLFSCPISDGRAAHETLSLADIEALT